MKTNFQLLLLFCIVTIPAHTQSDQSSLLNIGDAAPPLRLRGWIKGKPVQKFEKGNIYVVAFWATWCKPCKAAMPHLSALAAEYKDKVTILGVDVYEKKVVSIAKLTAFVDSMGARMDYPVAAEDSNFMEVGWLDGTGERGIPKTFIVNAEGKLAWIGHPKNLSGVLPKIISNTWNIKEALETRNRNIYLAYLDKEAFYDLYPYADDRLKPGDLGQPDSALLMINEIVRKEPALTYAPFVASNTFASLLKTNPQKAYEYGKLVMVTATYEEPAYSAIYGAIDFYSNKLNIPAKLYQLGAEAYQAEIDQVTYPEIANTSKLYHNMAAFYRHAKNKSKAIKAEQKAIEALKSKKDFSRTDLAAFESRLQQYKKL